MAYRILIDTGGTFTDGVCVDDKGNLFTAKSPTTPEDLTIGTMNVVDALAGLCGLERPALLSMTATLVNGQPPARTRFSPNRAQDWASSAQKGFRM
jgi:N-methylhydantoinase A